MRKPEISIEQRIFNKIEKDKNGCWNWTACCNQGYGIISKNGKNKQARRVLFEIKKSKVPDGECLLSICKNTLCVNPDHMFLQSERLDLFTKKNDETGCIEWTKKFNNRGYGIINHDGKLRLAHRVMYETKIGKIPEKKNLCHKCDNPSCVNTDHLFVGTHKENMQDMIKKGRSRKRYGSTHPYAKINEEIVKEIKIMLKTNPIYTSVAKIYNISPNIVRNIAKNINWKHVLIS